MKQILFLLAAVLLLGGCAEEKKTDVRWATSISVTTIRRTV